MESVVESALDSLKRLNVGINEMKKWTSERATLQSEIYRLQVALHNVGKDAPSILLSQDPLVKHQTEEIRRLESTNDKMNIKLQSLRNELLHTKQSFSWSVHERVKNQMSEINSRTEEERQELLKEISNLKGRIDECKTGTQLQQLKMDLNVFIESDKMLDSLFNNVLNKGIVVIKKLSHQLEVNHFQMIRNVRNFDGKVMRNCSDESIDDDSEKLEYLSCNEELELRDINFEAGDDKMNGNYLQEMKMQLEKLKNDKQILIRRYSLKEGAFKESLSAIKGKLAIALMKNNELDEKIKRFNGLQTKCNFSTQTDSVIQTENEIQRLEALLKVTQERLKTTNDELVNLHKQLDENNNKEQLESELMAMKNQNDDITRQLIMEQTTAKEALKQFEKSAKEIERLEAELEDIKLDRVTLKKEIGKLRLENSELKDMKMTYKKKKVVLTDEGIKERETLNMKIKMMSSRNNKLMGDLKIANNKNNRNEQIIIELEEKNKNFQLQVEFLLKDSEEIAETLKKKEHKHLEFIDNINKLEDEIKQLKNQREELCKDVEIANEKVEIANEKVTKIQDEYLSLQQISFEENELNERLQKTIEKNIIEIDNLTSRISDADNESRDLKYQIETVSLRISALQLENEELKVAINNLKLENKKLTSELLTSNAENHSLKSDLRNVLNEINVQKNRDSVSPAKNESKVYKIKANQATENSTKKVNEDIEKKKDKLVDNYERTLKKNLRITEKELSLVKKELSKVKYDIGDLKNDLENGKYGMYNLEMENIALKEELAKLRAEKLQLTKEFKKSRTAKKA